MYKRQHDGPGQPGDIIAILGKGHETTIERGGIKEPFVEREIVEEYWGR